MDAIKIERARYGMSQKELAEALGVATSTVSQWERGTQKPRVSQLINMSNLFHCTTDYLLSLSENRTPKE